MKSTDSRWQKLVNCARTSSALRQEEISMPPGFAHKIVAQWMARQRPSIEEIWEKMCLKACIVALTIVMACLFLAHQPAPSSAVYDYTMANAELSNLPWP